MKRRVHTHDYYNRLYYFLQICYNVNMAYKKPPIVRRAWSITVPAADHLKSMQEKTGMQPGQLVSFAIIALDMGLTRSDYVSHLLQSGQITLKEAKEGWGI